VFGGVADAPSRIRAYYDDTPYDSGDGYAKSTALALPGLLHHHPLDGSKSPVGLGGARSASVEQPIHGQLLSRC
jgi:hypothetical protein